MPLRAIATYTCIEAMRNRLNWLLALLLVTGFALTEFIGELALTETREFQSGFMGAFLRASAVFVVSLYVITSMVREFNDKGLELILSLPIPRASYFFGKLAGFTVLGLSTAALCSALLLVYVPPVQAVIWGLSLAAELTIVIAFGLLCLFTLNQVTLALSAVMAFYVLARSISALQLMAHGPFANEASLSQKTISLMVDGLAFLLPRLDRFTASEWLIYHTAQWSTLAPILTQTLVYVALLCGAALFDLYRKNL